MSVKVVAGANPFTPLTLPITTGGPGTVAGGTITLRGMV